MGIECKIQKQSYVNRFFEVIKCFLEVKKGGHTYVFHSVHPIASVQYAVTSHAE